MANTIPKVKVTREMVKRVWEALPSHSYPSILDSCCQIVEAHGVCDYDLEENGEADDLFRDILDNFRRQGVLATSNGNQTLYASLLRQLGFKRVSNKMKATESKGNITVWFMLTEDFKKKWLTKNAKPSKPTTRTRATASRARAR